MSKRITFGLALAVAAQMLSVGLTASRAEAQDSPAVECMSLPGEPRITVRIDRGFGSAFQNATVRTPRNSSFHNVSRRPVMGWDRISYWGNDFDLDIDTFMAGRIDYYQSYWATLSTPIVSRGRATQVRCEFLPF